MLLLLLLLLLLMHTCNAYLYALIVLHRPRKKAICCINDNYCPRNIGVRQI